MDTTFGSCLVFSSRDSCRQLRCGRLGQKSVDRQTLLSRYSSECCTNSSSRGFCIRGEQGSRGRVGSGNLHRDDLGRWNALPPRSNRSDPSNSTLFNDFARTHRAAMQRSTSCMVAGTSPSSAAHQRSWPLSNADHRGNYIPGMVVRCYGRMSRDSSVGRAPDCRRNIVIRRSAVRFRFSRFFASWNDTGAGTFSTRNETFSLFAFFVGLIHFSKREEVSTGSSSSFVVATVVYHLDCFWNRPCRKL